MNILQKLNQKIIPFLVVETCPVSERKQASQGKRRLAKWQLKDRKVFAHYK